MLSEKDLTKICDTVSGQVLKGVEEKAAKYYVDRRKHWKHHLWLGWIITFLKYVTWTAVVGLVLSLFKLAGLIFHEGLLSTLKGVAIGGGVKQRDISNHHWYSPIKKYFPRLFKLR